MTTLDLPVGRRARRPFGADQNALCSLLLLGLSGSDLSTDLAASTVPDLRRQFRIGDHRRTGLHARTGARQPCRRLGVETTTDQPAAAAGGDRAGNRHLRNRVAGCFEQVGALIVDWPLPAMAAVNLLLVHHSDLLMGATLPILVSHLVRRSGEVGGRSVCFITSTPWARARPVSELRRAVPVPRHARCDLCRRRHQCCGRDRRHRGTRISSR